MQQVPATHEGRERSVRSAPSRVAFLTARTYGVKKHLTHEGICAHNEGMTTILSHLPAIAALTQALAPWAVAWISTH